MKKTLRFLMLFAIGLFLALSVTSCGDDEEDDGTTIDTPAKIFTVTFNSDGGSEIVAQKVDEGNTTTKPADPTKDGFYFLGWYIGENIYDFSQPVSDDLTITALWMKKTEYEVDLGLPSRTMWAICNVGAKNPWNYGDYFAWGETKTKDDYSWSTYKFANGGDNQLTKYCYNSSYGYNGFTDNLTVLLPEDDAATANCGSDWRMPTQAEFQELRNNCDSEWTSDYNGTGVAGLIVKSRNNSNSIFLPAAGHCYDVVVYVHQLGLDGYYWSSSLSTGLSSDCHYLWVGQGYGVGRWPRYYGFPIRPVRCK